MPPPQKQAPSKVQAARVGASAANNQRSNEMNPNNRLYHRARGLAERPANWMKIVEDKRDRGQRQHILNLASHETTSERAAQGRNMVKVEAAVKAVHAQARVELGGSRLKKTNLAGADQDVIGLFIGTPVLCTLFLCV